MKPFYVSLGAGGSTPMTGAGVVRKIKVRKADGPVLFKTNRGEVAPGIVGETITFEFESDTIQVINEHDTNNNLQLMVIASAEGALDAASSSVEINNPDDLKGAPTDLIREEFWDLYKFKTSTPDNFGSIELTLNAGNTNLIAMAREWAFIERLTIEVVQGELALILPPMDPDHVGSNDYRGSNDSTSDYPSTDVNPLIPGGLSLEWYPRYYAGEKIHLDYRDRIHAAYAHHPGSTGQTIIRASWLNLTTRKRFGE